MIGAFYFCLALWLLLRYCPGRIVLGSVDGAGLFLSVASSHSQWLCLALSIVTHMILWSVLCSLLFLSMGIGICIRLCVVEGLVWIYFFRIRHLLVLGLR